MQLFEVKYIGQCRDKGRGSQAFGWVRDSWFLIFPEQVLRDWFEAGPAPIQQPDQAANLYAVLGVPKTASPDEIKSAFRRMARHPDVCKEPNAHDQFIRIQEASSILSDSLRRAKYDAGLAFEASIKQANYHQSKTIVTGSYRSPLRCGAIMVDGSQSGKWFVVKSILAWEDVTRGNQILVASWPMGAQQPVEQWV
jgi:hypothetical protein